MGVITRAANLYFIYKFIRILTTPFSETDAFKLGIVDENGKILIAFIHCFFFVISAIFFPLVKAISFGDF